MLGYLNGNCDSCKEAGKLATNGTWKLCRPCYDIQVQAATQSEAPALTQAATFEETHAKHLQVIYGQAQEVAAAAAKTAAQKFSAGTQGYSIDGKAIKATCKELKIKATYKAIFAWFGTEPKKAPARIKAAPVTPEERLKRMQAGRLAKVLEKKVRLTRYDGQVMTLGQAIRCLVEEGAGVRQFGDDRLLWFDKDQRGYGEGFTTKLGMDYAAQLLNGRA